MLLYALPRLFDPKISNPVRQIMTSRIDLCICLGWPCFLITELDESECMATINLLMYRLYCTDMSYVDHE